MGRKCSTVYDNKSCKSGYLNDTSGYRVLGFPTEIEERKRWLANLPNMINLEDVTKNMGVCLKHWEADFKYRIGPGGYLRPLHPPTIWKYSEVVCVSNHHRRPAHRRKKCNF